MFSLFEASSLYEGKCEQKKLGIAVYLVNERPGMEKIAKLCRERQAWKNVGKLFAAFVFASSV